MWILPPILFFGLCLQVEGQAQLPAQALELLTATRPPADRAWGAYLCGSLAVEACKQPLIEALEASAARLGNTPAPDSPEYFRVQFVLDALIRLRAKVPPALALRFQAGWRDEAFLLFLLSNPPEEVLLALPEADRTAAEWIAVNNALLERHSGPFFLRMARSKRFTHHFYVRDKDPIYGGIVGGIGDDVFHAPMIRTVPDGFPPVGVYELEAGGKSGETLVSTGPCVSFSNIVYSRSEITAAGTPVKPVRHSIGFPPIHCIDAYLAAFSGMREADAQPILRPSTDIRWSTSIQFRRQAEAAMERSATALRQFLVDGLIGHLTYGKEIPITITPVLTDLRENKRVSLPPIAPKTLVLN